METIKLDLIPGKKMPSLHASQYDDGRDYHIDLTENRVPYTLDGTETISLTVRKCDNTLVTMDVANVFGGKSYIEFRTTEQMNACAGFNYGEITIEKNGTQISSLNFYLQVEGAPDEGGITSQSEINNLKRQVHDIVVEELEDNGASETGYDNTESGLEATNVQDAIDEVNTKIDNIPSVDAYTKEQSDEKYATKTELSNKADVSAIPTKTSQLQNDSDFAQIDDTQASNSKTYSSEKIETALNGKADAVLTSIDPSDTLNGYVMIYSTGEIRGGQSESYVVYKFKVSENSLYYITSASNWGNLLYQFRDANDVLLEKGVRANNASTVTSLADEPVRTPLNSAYLYIAGFNSTPYCKTTITKTWQGKKWAVVGDSLTHVNLRATKRYFDYVSEKTGISVVNLGVSGSGYARQQDENKAFYQIVGNCPNDCDVVTIFGSFNDLGAGIPLGSYTDNDNTTIAGCINLTIDNLQSVMPLLNLGIVSPTPWNSTHPYAPSTSKDYVEMLKTICEYRSIPFLNLWECSNLRPWDNSFRAIAYSRDEGNGVHPDENGHKLIAPRFEAFLDSLLIH